MFWVLAIRFCMSPVARKFTFFSLFLSKYDITIWLVNASIGEEIKTLPSHKVTNSWVRKMQNSDLRKGSMMIFTLIWEVSLKIEMMMMIER